MNTFQRIVVSLMSAGLLAVSVDAALATSAVVNGAVGTESSGRHVGADLALGVAITAAGGPQRDQ